MRHFQTNRRMWVLPLYIKRIIVLTKLIIYLSASFLLFLTALRKIIFYQIENFMNRKLSKHLCGFRKGFSAQHCLLVMLEKWRAYLDNGGCSGVLLTDLSKAFDCLAHDLLTAKMAAYGFDHNATQLIHSYLTNRPQY